MGSVARPAVLAALLLVLAGCGGGASAPATGDPAELAPADAQSFALLRTDAEDEDVRRAVELLERLPAVRDHELDLEREVLPALGDEAALVVLAEGERVWLVRPDDRERFDELVERMRKRPVTREVEGWLAVAGDDAALEAYQRGREGGSLSDREDVRDALEGLADDAVVRVWSSPDAEGPLRDGVLAVRAAADGFELEGHRPGGADVEPYRPSLLDRVPAGATVATSFHGSEGLADRLRMLPFLAALDRHELAAVVEGEGVLYVRPSALVPELTLLAEVRDEEAATRAAASLLESMGAIARGPGSAQFGPLAVHYGARDGLLVLTSSPAALDVLRPAAGGGLPADPAFERIAQRAGLGVETTGFLFVRGDELAPMLGVLSLLGGPPPKPEVRENLAALGSVLLHGSRDGDRRRVSGVVEVPER